MGTTPSAASRSSCEPNAPLPTLTPPELRYSLGQRCVSLYHNVWYRLSERLRWSRRPFRETPVDQLSGLAPWQAARIKTLQACFGIRFECHYGQPTAMANYGYLDLLDQAWKAVNRRPGQGDLVTDVGCANFWYARTLHAFFRPARLTGVDIEGYRLYPTGYSRYDAASGYVGDLPHTAFVVADYCDLNEPADVITAWFPFVTPAPVLAWRLPLAVLCPERLFAAIARNLRTDGAFFMVNQGPGEAAIAAAYCRQAGLHSQGQWSHPHPLRERPLPPVASWWGR